MNLTEHIERHFVASIETKTRMKAAMPAAIAQAAQNMAACLKSGGKLLACGNGGSAGDAQHFAAELVGRFEREREELAAIALTTDSSILTAIANDYSFDVVFAKQVRGLGKAGDILFAISTSGNSKNVIAAIEAAHAKNISVVAMTGRDGGTIRKLLQSNDVLLNVESTVTARIQEVHLLTLHCLCDAIDHLLFGEKP
jgi:D-sedoheptulose 7-phosphate isomerase